MNELLSPEVLGLLKALAISAGLGLLVGLERERSKAAPDADEVFLGVRTLPLVALWGVLATWLSERFSPWILGTSILGLLLLLGANYYLAFQSRKREPGLTTVMATVVTFLLGALVYLGFPFVASVVAVTMTTALAYKPQIHRVARGLSQKDLSSILQFAVLMAIVIPLLPTKPIDPQGALVPREIGWMVTLIAGIGLFGFLLVQVIGPRKGIRFTGAVGGLVSSTAVVLTFSRQSRDAKSRAGEFGLAMGLACAIMYPRVLIEVFVVQRELLPWMAATMIPMLAVSAGMFWFLSRREGPAKTDAGDGELKVTSPTDLKVALQFGLLYAGIRWLSSFMTEHLGSDTLYLLALAAGTADVDAITLSVAQMAGNQISEPVAVFAITLAAISNTLVKLGMAWFIADPDARVPALKLLAPAAAVGVGAMGVLWLVG